MALRLRSPSAVFQGLLGGAVGEPRRAVKVAADRLLRADGVAVAGLRCGPLDVTSLDEERRGALSAAFSHLCRTLEAPLQLLVRVRLWTSDEAPDPPPDARAPLALHLAAAEKVHEGHLLAERPAYRRELFVLTTVPADPSSAARGRDVVEVALQAAGVEVERLDGPALAALVAEAWGDSPRPLAAGTTLQPPGWSAGTTKVQSGAQHLRGFRLRHFPGVAVEAGWLAPILRVRADCDIGLHLEPVRLDDAMSRLSRRLRALRADQLSELERETTGDATVEAGVDAALDLRDRLARNEGRPLTVSMTAVARGRDARALDAASAAVSAGFAMTLARATPAHLDHLSAAISTLPLVDDRSPHRKLVDSSAAATCVPFVEAVCNDPGGSLIGCALGSDTPVRLALFDRSRYPNANVAVLAASGRGKSYAIGMLVLNAAASGTGSVIIDPEGEYERLVHALGGRYMHLRPGCGTALNIFDVGLTDGADDDGDAAVGAVLALVDTLLGGTLDQNERAHVDAAARAAASTAQQENRSAVLGDCVDELGDVAPRVAPVLRRFCHGPLGDLFNRPTSLHTAEGVIGLGLRDLREELVAPATLIVAEWLWALVRRDRRDRHIVFDEVGLLLAYPALRTLLAQLARRCRKYGASLVVATQNAGDLLAGEEGRVIATNPATVLLGGHRGAETSRMQEAYSLTDAQRAWLEGASRGEFLLLAGARRLPVRISAPPLHHALLTGGDYASCVLQ